MMETPGRLAASRVRLFSFHLGESFVTPFEPALFSHVFINRVSCSPGSQLSKFPLPSLLCIRHIWGIQSYSL